MRKTKLFAFLIALCMILGSISFNTGAHAAEGDISAPSVHADTETTDKAFPQAGSGSEEGSSLQTDEGSSDSAYPQTGEVSANISSTQAEELPADDSSLLVEWDSTLPVNDVSADIGTEISFKGTLEEFLEAMGVSASRDGAPYGTITDPDNGSGSYGYSKLNDAQKSLYDSLKKACENFIRSEAYKEDLTVDVSKITGSCDAALSEKELDEVNYGFKYDNPQYYWLKSSWSWWCDVYGGESALIFNIDPYYYAAEVREEADSAIVKTGDKWIKEIKQIKTAEGEYEAVVRAHDLIIGEIDYAYDYSGEPESARWAHCMAGVFTGQGAVCEGYARCFQYLLNKAEIDNIYIVGTMNGSNSTGHAWNAVYLGGKYWLVDVTWDDPNEGKSALNDAEYLYFCMPSSEFIKNHKPDNMLQEGMYPLPEFGDTFDMCYYKVYNAYTTETLTHETAKTFADAVLGSQPKRADFVYFAVPDTDSVRLLYDIFGRRFSYYPNTAYGNVGFFESVKSSSPATTVSLSAITAKIEIGGSVNITAILPEGSDDRVLWTIDDTSAARLTTDGLTATVYGKRNGDVRLTAKTYSGGAEAYCDIVVGEGSLYSDATVWQNGKKDYKTFALSTTLTATSWTNEKGKTKQGKLIWIASDTDMVPTFDSVKHSLTNKPKPTIGKVNNKGIVSAKKAGRLYVFACDTGSCTYEKFVVEILGSPSKLYLTKTPGSTEKTDILKKVGLTAGTTGKVYITPFLKEGEADLTNEYSVELAKAEQASYASVSKVKTDDNGNAYFTVTALDFNRGKNKTASVKINVLCEQSGKKASMTVVINNPVTSVTALSPSGTAAAGTASSSAISLAKKKDTVALDISLTTALSGVNKTTDKVKLYIGKSKVELNAKGKPEADKGATVKGKLDVKNMTLTLKASKDAGATAVIKLGCTNAATKETSLFSIGTVDESGILTLK